MLQASLRRGGAGIQRVGPESCSQSATSVVRRMVKRLEYFNVEVASEGRSERNVESLEHVRQTLNTNSYSSRSQGRRARRGVGVCSCINEHIQSFHRQLRDSMKPFKVEIARRADEPWRSDRRQRTDGSMVSRSILYNFSAQIGCLNNPEVRFVVLRWKQSLV